uniref:Uncharacterized protein n=1 Tax=Papilio xuthus TaxID=66420 RepID=I4DKJ5_PAPXU|nr:unknown unsecreted protein [Papilio xuthus]
MAAVMKWRECICASLSVIVELNVKYYFYFSNIFLLRVILILYKRLDNLNKSYVFAIRNFL